MTSPFYFTTLKINSQPIPHCTSDQTAPGGSNHAAGNPSTDPAKDRAPDKALRKAHGKAFFRP